MSPAAAYMYIQTWPQGYKNFLMLNSDEQEILFANKQQIADKYRCFLAQFNWVKTSLCL